MQILENMDKCCGCGACQNKCPVDAITMEMNGEGFFEPVVDNDKCINCGACQRVCPVLHKEHSNSDNPRRYAITVTDESVLNYSSSGGAFTLLAEEFLKEGGYVVGAAFTQDFDVHHVIINSIEQLDSLRRSKYVQSDQEFCYRETEKLLKEGKKVLYSGCPCQIAGLMNFLGKEYPTLYTIDLLCHGVPSPKVFKEHLDNTYNMEDVADIDMRSRDGWGTTFNVIHKDGNVEKHHTRRNIYQRSFLNDLISRRSCYSCEFTHLPRYADFTLGDNWNAKKMKLGLPYEKKSSIVLVNNDRALSLWESVIKSSTKKIECRDLTESFGIKDLNKNVYEPIVTSMDKREEFYKKYTNMNFEEAAYKTMYPYNVGLILYMSDNYGSCATNYALYKAIEELGFSPVILDNLVAPTGVSARFAKDNLSLSSTFMEKDDYKAANTLCDSFVIGSDQSLRWDFSLVKNNLEYMLMEFAASNKRKIGYAVSFGPERYNLDSTMKDLYTHSLNRFDALSVREDYAVNMCKRNFDVDADWVVDPVFLVEKQTYVDVVKKSTLTFDEPYILVYIRHAAEDKKTLIKNVQKELGIKLIVITDAQGHENLKNDLNIDEIIDKVEFVDWLAYFANASYVITDSFHGTCFSIIFEKKYISLKAGTTQRFDSLANLLDSSDDTTRVQIFGDIKPLLNKKEAFKELDYNDIRNKILIKRKECLDWLNNALTKEPKQDGSMHEVIFNYAKQIKQTFNSDLIKQYGYEEWQKAQQEELFKKSKTFLDVIRKLNGEPAYQAEPITDIDNVEEYFDTLAKQGKYTVLISVKDSAAAHFKNFVKKSKLPLKKELKMHNSYLAIIRNGDNIYEDMSNGWLQKRCILNPLQNMQQSYLIDETELQNNSLMSQYPLYVHMVSMKYDSKLQNQKSVISINNINYSLDRRGVNIVVIDNNLNRVVDSFRIDLHADANMKMHRKR